MTVTTLARGEEAPLSTLLDEKKIKIKIVRTINRM